MTKPARALGTHITTLPTGIDMTSHVAALGWLHTNAGGDNGSTAAPRALLALPIDLYMVSVHLAAHDQSLDMAVTLLRTRPQRFHSQGGGQLAFGLLTPAGVLALLRAPLQGRTDHRLGLEEFCSTQECGSLREQLLQAPEPNERMMRFAHWLEDRINRRHGFRAAQQRVAQAAASLHDTHAAPEWPAVRDKLGLSQRQMERDFRTWLGISPNGYARLVRFQRAVQGLVAGGCAADTANAHLFFDQAHMSRNIKAYTSLTPRELCAAATRPQRLLEQRSLAGRVLVIDAPERPARSAHAVALLPEGRQRPRAGEH